MKKPWYTGVSSSEWEGIFLESPERSCCEPCSKPPTAFIFKFCLKFEVFWKAINKLLRYFWHHKFGFCEICSKVISSHQTRKCFCLDFAAQLYLDSVYTKKRAKRVNWKILQKKSGFLRASPSCKIGIKAAKICIPARVEICSYHTEASIKFFKWLIASFYIIK